MLEWLTRIKKRSELPEYSALRAVPTRALPSDLTAEEAGESFTGRADGIERDLRDPAHLPGVDIPLFTELISSDGKRVVSIPMPDEDGHCLPVFSTSFRAADYQRTLLTSDPAVQYLSSTATQLFGMLLDFEKFGITKFALDRCPRCPTFPAYGRSPLMTPHDLLVVRAVHKATESARMELYFGYALNSARAGKLETARDVALETVGHVDTENPRPHLLLGELGLALGDRTLLREAQEFLRFLGHDRWARTLDDIVRVGQGRSKDQIRASVESQFDYDLRARLDEIRPTYRFDETCQGTVPQALIAFFESTSYEDAIRNAVSLGGDADTLACIAGGIAEAYYGGVPPDLATRGIAILDERLVAVVDRFREKFRLVSRGA